MEQDTGVEPAFTAWEAVVLPIYESCVLCGYYSIGEWKIQVFFVGGMCYNSPKPKGGTAMAEYELVREIKNLCKNNQMRDIFFEEIECGSPEGYIRSLLKGKELEMTVEPGQNGCVTIHAVVDGLMQKFVFTPI